MTSSPETGFLWTRPEVFSRWYQLTSRPVIRAAPGSHPPMVAGMAYIQRYMSSPWTGANHMRLRMLRSAVDLAVMDPCAPPRLHQERHPRSDAPYPLQAA